MKQDEAKWNGMYASGDYCSHFADIVKEYALKAPDGGRALDIASGIGLHARHLATLGYAVDAVDISQVALAQLDDVPGVTTQCCDLDAYEVAAKHYDVIVQIKYSGRHLFPLILEGLKPGGMFILETFLMSPEGGALTFPFRKEYLIRPNELLGAFAPLRIVYYREEKALGNDGSEAWKVSMVAVNDLHRYHD